jgi:hypothetical protein
MTHSSSPASPVFLVTVQSVEYYGERYYKFKGGFNVLVSTDKDATAFGLVLEYLVANKLASGYYPKHAERFETEADALATLDPEWETVRVRL